MEFTLLRVREAGTEPVTTPEAVVALMEAEARADRECLWVLHLNTKNCIIEKELVSMGTLDSSLVSGREVYRKAVINSTASIILVHNHPSGDLSPSKDDRRISKQMKEAGKLLDIELLDFIIIAQGRHFSFKEQNII